MLLTRFEWLLFLENYNLICYEIKQPQVLEKKTVTVRCTNVPVSRVSVGQAFSG